MTRRRAATVEAVEAIVAAMVVGLIGGVGSALFLRSLDWAGRTRVNNGWLLWLLPLAGLAMGALYHYGGGRSKEGMSLVFNEMHEPTEHLPRRLAPLIFVTAVVTHLFGGSAGREGVALLVTGGVADQLPRAARRPAARRGWLLTLAVAAGFGAVFGTPVAGALFALEVPRSRRFQTGFVLVPCLIASFVGDRVTRSLGGEHTVMSKFDMTDATLTMLLRVAVLGALCGLVALAYIHAVELVRSLVSRVTWPPLRPFIGGAVVVVLALVAGRQYLGLSVELGDAAVAGGAVGLSVFAWKLVFTAVTLGSGFQGGEVTPLFVMGATFGGAFADVVGLPSGMAASLGFVAVFGAASNTPIACAVVAVELFGASVLPFAIVATAVATVVSTRRSIYPAQR